MEITNYTDAQTVSVYKGLGKLQISSTKLIYLIDLEQLETELYKIREHTINDLMKESYLYHTLTHEIVQAFSVLSTLTSKYRKVRSINWIGSAWKFLAGNPDHDDLTMIENNLNSLITNNNDQVIVNKQLQSRINNLTTISDMLTNTIKRDNTFNNDITTSLQNQVRLIKEEIVNIKYAIQWAKINIINTLLLNEFEINEVHKIFQKNNVTSLSVEEMLEFVDVSVLHNKTAIIYIIKIPELDPTTYQDMLIKPVIKNNSIVHLETNEIFVAGNEIINVPKNCKVSNYLKICKKENTVNLRQTKCIAKLIEGKEALCDFSNAEHVQEIEEIDGSLILLNNYTGNLIHNNITYNLKGTYLVHFWNDTVQINKKQYNNKEKTIPKPGTPIIQMSPIEMERFKILSLKSLEALHIKNTQYLNNIITHSTINRIAIFCLLGTIILLAIISKVWFRPREKITVQIQQELPTLNNKIKTNNLKPKPIQPEFNNIPYF